MPIKQKHNQLAPAVVTSILGQWVLGTLGYVFVSVQILLSTAETNYIVLVAELICAFIMLFKLNWLKICKAFPPPLSMWPFVSIIFDSVFLLGILSEMFC